MWVKCQGVFWNTTHDHPRDDRLSVWPQQISVGRHWLQRRKDRDGSFSSFKETAQCLYLSSCSLANVGLFLSWRGTVLLRAACTSSQSSTHLPIKSPKQVSSVHAPPHETTMARCLVSVTWHNSIMCTSVRLWYRWGDSAWPLNREKTLWNSLTPYMKYC